MRAQILEAEPSGSRPEMTCFLQEKTDQQKQTTNRRGWRGSEEVGGGSTKTNRRGSLVGKGEEEGVSAGGGDELEKTS